MGVEEEGGGGGGEVEEEEKRRSIQMCVCSLAAWVWWLTL